MAVAIRTFRRPSGGSRRVGVARLYLVAVVMWCSLSVGVSQSAPQEPVRAIFDEGNYWALTSSEVDRVLSRIKRAGFNTYIPCVWHGQGAMWPSKVAPVWAANPSLAKNDAFGAFLAAAHKKGVKVMPCFTLALRQADILPEFVSESRPEGVFDVQDPEFHRFLRDMVVEFVARYDVDGVNLDYVRAGQVCYDASCRESYTRATGRNLIADLAIHRVNAEALDSIVVWQRRAVAEMVRGVASAARRTRPDLVVTVDAAPWAESVVIEGQDSLQWADSGTIDLVFSMNYEPAIDWRKMARLRNGMQHPERLAVMIGNYDERASATPVSRSGPAVAQLAAEAEEFNARGSFAVYIYSLLTDAQVSSLAGITRK